MINNNVKQTPEKCKSILKDYAKTLVLNESNQSLVSHLGDYYTADLANEWNYEHFEYFINILLEKKMVDETIISLYKTIEQRFIEASFNNPLYDEVIWTLDGFKNHPFWEEQRRLAKEILKKLE